MDSSPTPQTKLGHHPGAGTGVIWNGVPFETLVIPAKAGIQFFGGAFPMTGGVDSRFRGNDRVRERLHRANDTTTRERDRLTPVDCSDSLAEENTLRICLL